LPSSRTAMVTFPIQLFEHGEFRLSAKSGNVATASPKGQRGLRAA
jgi:hypothetical protein